MDAAGVSTFLARADDAVGRGDWAGAVDAARRALAEAPGDPDAAALLRMAERRLSADQPSTPEPQRQQLTVMFCDVVGSTDIANRIEIEAYRELLLEYQSTCSAIIAQYEGHVARFIGDGLLVYFGYPATHDDDARRAVLAGLAMTRAMRTRGDDIRERYGVDLQMRVGIHTGDVIISDMGAGRWTAASDIIGPTPNLAARLEGQAPPDSVAISGVTADLVEGYVVTSSMGTPALKGFDDPIEVFEVVRALPASNRLDAAARLSAFVGREGERATLVDAWRAVTGGDSQAIHISGEAGMGKSRLAHWVRTSMEFVGADHIEGSCSPYRAGQPFHAFASVLTDLTGIDDMSEPVLKEKALLFALGDDDGGPLHAAPFLAALVGVELRDHPLPPVSAEQQRELTIGAIIDWVRWRATQSPTTLVIEDLHWADPSSLEALARLCGERVPSLLVVSTARPGGPAPEGATSIVLSSLDSDEAASLVRSALADHSLDDDEIAAIVDRSGGVPLFVEELARARTSGHALEAIPTSLRDLLTARLNALGPERGLAQLIATIADEVPARVLAELSPLRDEELEQQLALLMEAELLTDVRRGGSRTYAFRHALQRDAAYDMQIRTRRTELHTEIADRLPQVAPVFAEQQPALMAHHCEMAGRPADAVRERTRAGRQAADTAANAEAIGHYEEALRLIGELEPGPATDAAELEVRVGVALAVVISQGYTAPDSERHWARAKDLVDRLGRPPETMPALWGHWAFRLLRGQIDAAYDLAREIVQVAAGGTDTDKAFADSVMGEQYLYMGRFAECVEQSERGSRFDDLEVAMRLAQHPGLASLSNVGAVSALRGDIDRGLDIAARAAAQAEEVAFPLGPITEAFIHHRLAWAALPCGLPDLSFTHAARCFEIASAHGFAVWMAHGGAQMAAVQAVSAPAEAIPALEATVDGFLAVGAPLGVSNYLAALAAACLDAGDAEAALAHADRGIDLGTTTADVVFMSDLHRIRALARSALGASSDETARELATAVDVGRAQGHHVFELRAALALLDAGDPDGLDAVRAAHEHFPSAVTTPDLERARAALSP